MGCSTVSDPVSVNPARGGLILRTVRKTRVLIGKPGPSVAQVAYDRDCTSTNLREVEISGFAQPTDEIKDVFAGVERFPEIDVYVHGSWADDTRTAFSDLDDLIIIDRMRITDVKQARRLERWLNQVDMRFCRIDPLQHHGHWLVYKNELEHYDESYMPLSVLRGGMRVQGAATVRAYVDEQRTATGLRHNLAMTLSSIRRFYDKYEESSISLYDMKRLTGSFLLAPAYAFQTRGARVSKRWALENAARIYSERGLRAIDCCSSIRADWHLGLRGAGYTLFSWVPRLFADPHLYRRLASRLSPRFPRGAFPELEECWVEAFIDQSARYVGHD